jgi:hypothetical protein
VKDTEVEEDGGPDEAGEGRRRGTKGRNEGEEEGDE